MLIQFLKWLIAVLSEKPVVSTPPAPVVRGQLGIIVGHEKKSKGAYSKILGSEYDFNTGVADIILKAATARGLKAKVFFRDGRGIGGVGADATAWARAEKEADCVVELHFNAYKGTARGTDVLYDSDPSDSKAFAQICYDKICQALSRTETQRRNRGKAKLLTSGDRGVYNLEAVKVPSCLLEPVFGDNTLDAQLLKDRKVQYANAIVDAALEFLKTKQG